MDSILCCLHPIPSLEYDSWVTIGLDRQPESAAGEAAVRTVQEQENLGSRIRSGRRRGANMVIDDSCGGAWYVLNGDSNGLAGC